MSGDDVNEKLWGLMSSYLGHERWFIQKQIVNHIEYTVVKSRFHFDKSHLSAAVASSIRDRLIECFNDTNQHYAVTPTTAIKMLRNMIRNECITCLQSTCKVA